MTVIIIALDIGSSSIRCTAYKYRNTNNNKNDVDDENDDDFVVLVSARKPRRSIQENGQIVLDGLFEDIDALMDEIHTSLAVSIRTDETQRPIIAAIGITSFVMNLIGVDVHGKPVIDPTASCTAATLSYACQSKQVDEELVNLKRYMSMHREKMELCKVVVFCHSHIFYLFKHRITSFIQKKIPRSREITSHLSAYGGTHAFGVCDWTVTCILSSTTSTSFIHTDPLLAIHWQYCTISLVRTMYVSNTIVVFRSQLDGSPGFSKWSLRRRIVELFAGTMSHGTSQIGRLHGHYNNKNNNNNTWKRQSG
jgi:hypothetical protein